MKKKVERSSPLQAATVKKMYVLVSRRFFEMFWFFFRKLPSRVWFQKFNPGDREAFGKLQRIEKKFTIYQNLSSTCLIESFRVDN